MLHNPSQYTQILLECAQSVPTESFQSARSGHLHARVSVERLAIRIKQLDLGLQHYGIEQYSPNSSD